MAFTSLRGTITDSATSIIAGPSAEAGVGQLEVAVRVPAGGSAVYIGGTAVTSSTGFAVNGGETLSLDLDASESVYGVTASGSQVVHVLASSNDDVILRRLQGGDE